MTLLRRKNKKVNKYRGSVTHGRGNTKNGRGHGSKGGRGRAGSKKHKASKYRPTIGKSGFSSKIPAKKAINLSVLSNQIASGKITVKDNIINLSELGYHKLLGGGTAPAGVKIKVSAASKKAIEKVEAVDGEVVIE